MSLVLAFSEVSDAVLVADWRSKVEFFCGQDWRSIVGLVTGGCFGQKQHPVWRIGGLSRLSGKWSLDVSRLPRFAVLFAWNLLFCFRWSAEFRWRMGRKRAGYDTAAVLQLFYWRGRWVPVSLIKTVEGISLWAAIRWTKAVAGLPGEHLFYPFDSYLSKRGWAFNKRTCQRNVAWLQAHVEVWYREKYWRRFWSWDCQRLWLSINWREDWFSVINRA